MIGPNAGIAQLVEHLIRNEGVAGSSPVSGTTVRPVGFVWQATFRVFDAMGGGSPKWKKHIVKKNWKSP